MAAHLRVPGAAPFAAGGAVEGRSRRRGASGAAPRFLGRCYGHAPRHPALLGVAEGGRRRGRGRRADRRSHGGWERSGEAAFAAVRRSRRSRKSGGFGARGASCCRPRAISRAAPVRVSSPASASAAPDSEPPSRISWSRARSSGVISSPLTRRCSAASMALQSSAALGWAAAELALEACRARDASAKLSGRVPTRFPPSGRATSC